VPQGTVRWFDAERGFGFLALGAKETVQFSPHEAAYEDLGERVYRKVA